MEASMKFALLSIALGSQLLVPVADRVPTFNVEPSCRGAVAANSASNLVDAQSLSACMADENSARQELLNSWSSYSAASQNLCENEADAGGLPSYVDLLVCLQLSKDVAA